MTPASPSVHPTPFELRAFGSARLPVARTRGVLHHLRAGCRACLTRLVPNLIPWLDDEPAAEARASDPWRCPPSLAREYLRAAARAVRAAMLDGVPALESSQTVQAVVSRWRAEALRTRADDVRSRSGTELTAAAVLP